MTFSLLSCIWDVISEPVNRCLGRAADDCLGFLWERVTTSVRDYTNFWGNQVQQINTSATSDLAGLEEIRGYERKIADYLHDDGVGVIGIRDGRRRKLLERISNNYRQLGAPGHFQVVIWVTVSQVNLREIQKSIAKRIGLTLPSEDPKERADQIFDVLRKNRFLLLVDDVGDDKMERHRDSQPTTENKSKVILTTRSTEVCHKMGANKLLELKVLNPSEAWKLFKEKVGAEVDLDAPLIEPYAKAVVQKCGGLPLALIVVGCAMAADVKDERVGGPV